MECLTTIQETAEGQKGWEFDQLGPVFDHRLVGKPRQYRYHCDAHNTVGIWQDTSEKAGEDARQHVDSRSL